MRNEKWKRFVPIALLVVLLVTPWIHRALFENLLLAIPEMDRVSAHWWVLAFSGISICIGCMIVGLG